MRVQGAGFRVHGSGCRISCFGVQPRPGRRGSSSEALLPRGPCPLPPFSSHLTSRPEAGRLTSPEGRLFFLRTGPVRIRRETCTSANERGVKRTEKSDFRRTGKIKRTDQSGVRMGVAWRNHQFAPGLPPGWDANGGRDLCGIRHRERALAGWLPALGGRGGGVGGRVEVAAAVRKMGGLAGRRSLRRVGGLLHNIHYS